VRDAQVVELVFQALDAPVQLGGEVLAAGQLGAQPPGLGRRPARRGTRNERVTTPTVVSVWESIGGGQPGIFRR
jgi:hypothetical protein